MSFIKYNNVRITGITACVPENQFYVKDYDWISEKERIELINKTGIIKKHHCNENTTTSDLCYTAAEKLLQKINWNKEEIDVIIFVSQSRDYILPATACILQNRLNLPKTTLAFDIDLGCTGFIYGLSVVSGLLQSGQLKKALLLAGETPVRSSSYRDKTTYPLFGDAGVACAIEYSENFENSYFHFQSFGNFHDAIIIPESGFRNLPTRKTFKYRKYQDKIIRHKGQIHLNGFQILRFVLDNVIPNIKELIEYSNHQLDVFNYVILHQSNKLINEAIINKLKINKEKAPESLSQFGNTSSASIPLTIVHSIGKMLSNGKHKLLLSGFGSGLSVASAIVATENIFTDDVIIYKSENDKS
ncbi:MAG: ketoacyl-ACP synthase III [Marinilabiliales bacterium]